MSEQCHEANVPVGAAKGVVTVLIGKLARRFNLRVNNMASMYEIDDEVVEQIYSECSVRIDRLMNHILPKIHALEQVSEWQKDYDELVFAQRATQRALQEFWYPETMMKLARDELIKRDPGRWGGLPERVKPEGGAYLNPDLYGIWRKSHGL